MLESFRSNMKGVALGITILIAVVFIFSGTGTVFLANSNDGAAAKVGSTEISEFDVLRSISNQKQQILEQNPDIDMSLLSDEILRPAALERLIRREVLVQMANENKFSMSEDKINAEILKIDGFQTDGQFDQDRYKFVLQNQGYTHGSFKQMLNNDLIVQQLIAGISNTSFVTEFENQALASVSEQKRNYYYLIIPAESSKSMVSVSDQEILNFYQENLEDYLSEPKLKIDYIELNTEMLVSENSITEDMVKERFEIESAEIELSESRRVSHILITDPNDELIEEIQGKIKEGTSFETLVSDYSEDFGSVSVGGDLGYTSGDTFPETFEEVVLSLEINEVSAPTKTDSGTHFIKLTDVQTNEYVYEDERDRILSDLASESVSEIFVEKLEILRELSFNAESLAEVAEDVGLSLGTTEFFSRSGGVGIAANSMIVDAAFSDDVLKNAYASEVLELGADYYAVIKLNEFIDEQQKPFDDVKATIGDNLADIRLDEILLEKSENILEKLNSGDSIEEIAKDQNLEWQVVLDANRRGRDQSSEINGKVFEFNVPNGSSTNNYFKTQAGDYVVASLTTVSSGDYVSSDEATKLGITNANLSINQSSDLQGFEESLRKRLKIIQ